MRNLSAAVVLGLLSCGAFAATVDIHGYVKVDAIYEDAQAVMGNTFLYVSNNQTDGDRFSLTANQTRLIVNIKSDSAGGPEVSGRVEADFYGGGAENKANIMMRQAFVKFDWTDTNVSLLAGQTWDVVSPLFMPTVSFLAGGFSGNIGYRRPMIKLTKNVDGFMGGKLGMDVALARTIGGENTGVPTAQARVGYAADRYAFGVSGHSGKLTDDAPTDSVCFDVSLKLSNKVTLQGEVYQGQGLGEFTGSIGYSISTPALGDPVSVGATGGWAALICKLNDKWTMNLGWGSESNDEDDLVAPGNERSRNSSAFVNGWYSVSPESKIGLEYLHGETVYANGDSFDLNRFQVAFMFNF